MTKTLAYATPEVLKWARESAGLTVQDAARRIGMRWSGLEAAEQGVDLLTLRQAEKAAEVYQRPLAVLFMPAPPEEDQPETLFRRLPGAPKLPWRSEMRMLARRISDRQAAAVELYDLLDEVPPWTESADAFRNASVDELAVIARSALEISESEQEGWQDDWRRCATGRMQSKRSASL